MEGFGRQGGAAWQSRSMVGSMVAGPQRRGAFRGPQCCLQPASSVQLGLQFVWGFAWQQERELAVTIQARCWAWPVGPRARAASLIKPPWIKQDRRIAPRL